MGDLFEILVKNYRKANHIYDKHYYIIPVAVPDNSLMYKI